MIVCARTLAPHPWPLAVPPRWGQTEARGAPTSPPCRRLHIWHRAGLRLWRGGLARGDTVCAVVSASYAFAAIISSPPAPHPRTPRGGVRASSCIQVTPDSHELEHMQDHTCVAYTREMSGRRCTITLPRPLRRLIHRERVAIGIREVYRPNARCSHATHAQRRGRAGVGR